MEGEEIIPTEATPEETTEEATVEAPEAGE